MLYKCSNKKHTIVWSIHLSNIVPLRTFSKTILLNCSVLHRAFKSSYTGTTEEALMVLESIFFFQIIQYVQYKKPIRGMK